MPNMEMKFAEDGELLVRGASVFSGYWNKPAVNAECFDAEGWFLTGDIGHQDADGFLYITDRKKELLKTSGGKMVAPQPIENKLKNSAPGCTGRSGGGQAQVHLRDSLAELHSAGGVG